MAAKRLLLCEEITADSVAKVYKGGYSQIVLCTEGGDVESCRAICEYLLRKPTDIVVTGRCQSSGVLIAACGEARSAYPGTEWLHHEASGEVEGTAREIRAFADFLDRSEKWAYTLLGQRTTTPAGVWARLAKREYLFDNAEALRLGLIHREVA